MDKRPARSVKDALSLGLTTWVFLFLGPNTKDKASVSVLASFQIKATDNGQPPLSASVRLHIEWIPPPRPSSIPLAFDELHYRFTVMETDPVNHMVGVISVEGRPGLFWFSISGVAEQPQSLWYSLSKHLMVTFPGSPFFGH